MANVDTARPSSVTTPVVSCSVFGISGSLDWYLKVDRSRIRMKMTKVEPTTGDGDNAPAMVANYFGLLSFTLFGQAVAQSVDTSVRLFSSFLDPAKNPLSANFKLKLASSYVLNCAKVLIVDMELGYTRDGATMPVMISCFQTDTHATIATS